MKDKVKTLSEKKQLADKPPRLVSGKSSLAQIIKTKEQADEFMEKLNRAFNNVS